MDGETVTYDRRQGCCMHCGSLSFSQEWLNAFQVGSTYGFCQDSSDVSAPIVKNKLLRSDGCLAGHNLQQLQVPGGAGLQGKLPFWMLLSCSIVPRQQLHPDSEVAGRAQGNAKSLYMLTDGDLKKLGSLAKANPQKQYACLQRLCLFHQRCMHTISIAEQSHAMRAGTGRQCGCTCCPRYGLIMLCWLGARSSLRAQMGLGIQLCVEGLARMHRWRLPRIRSMGGRRA